MAVMLSYEEQNSRAAGHTDDANQMRDAHQALTYITGVILALIVGVLKCLATCSCVQGLNCGEWKCLCFSGPCFAKRIRGCVEFIGSFVMLVFGIVSFLAFTATLALAHFYLDEFPGFTGGFATNLAIGWGIGVASNWVFFTCLTYPAEKKALRKERCRIEGVVAGTVKKGCCHCLCGKSMKKMMQETWKVDIYDFFEQDKNGVVKVNEIGESIPKIELEFPKYKCCGCLKPFCKLLAFWTDKHDFIVKQVLSVKAGGEQDLEKGGDVIESGGKEDKYRAPTIETTVEEDQPEA